MLYALKRCGGHRLRLGDLTADFAANAENLTVPFIHAAASGQAAKHNVIKLSLHGPSLTFTTSISECDPFRVDLTSVNRYAIHMAPPRGALLFIKP